MMIRAPIASLLFAVLLVGCSPSAPSGSADTPAATPTTATAVSEGEWRLDAAESHLSFVSIKNNAVTEVHRFRELSGRVDAEGQGTLQIMLDSVDTGIGIRDQRMRDMLFDTSQFAQATARLSVDPAALRRLAPGDHQRLTTEVALDLHGISNRIPAILRVTRLDDTTWLVTSEQPLVVDATRFGLINGIDALRQAAGLQAIGSGVPVTVSLVFTGS